MSEEKKEVALAELSASFTRLIEAVAPSVVAIKASHGRDAASGFVWRQGVVVTADEAIRGRKVAAVAIGGQQYEASIIGRDPSTDIAVLKAETLPAPALSLSPSVSPKAGEISLAVGRREQGIAARLGIVSLAGQAWRSMRGGHIDSLIRLDITLDRRAEGSLVVDSEGRVFGMAVRGPRRSVLVIPAATIERIAGRIVEKGSLRPGYLGLGLHPVRIQRQGGQADVGLIVLGIADEGPGQKAGILQGDIITAWNGEAIAGMRDLMRRLNPDSVGQAVTLSLLRAGHPASLQCVIGARPQA